MPHLNNKQNKNTNPIISRQDYHLISLVHQRKKKQTNKQTKSQYKSHPIEAYTNQWTNLRRAEGSNQKEERIQPSSLRKGDLKHNKLNKNNEKAEKYYTNEGTN